MKEINKIEEELAINKSLNVGGDSNARPRDLESVALSPELESQLI